MNLKVLQVPKSQDPMEPARPGPWSKSSSFSAILFQSPWLFYFGFLTPLASFPLVLGPALNTRLELSLLMRWGSYFPHCSPLPCGLLTRLLLLAPPNTLKFSPWIPTSSAPSKHFFTVLFGLITERWAYSKVKFSNLIAHKAPASSSFFFFLNQSDMITLLSCDILL